MSDGNVLRSLIVRIEAATGGSRELDMEIGEITGRGYYDPPCLGSYCFSRSVDTALTLVPAPCWLTIETGTQLTAPSWQWPIVEIGSHTSGELIWRGQLKTLPLTILAAALKAMLP